MEAKLTALHAQVPLPLRRRGAWLNLALCVADLLAALFGGATLRSVDTLTLGAHCAHAGPATHRAARSTCPHVP